MVFMVAKRMRGILMAGLSWRAREMAELNDALRIAEEKRATLEARNLSLVKDLTELFGTGVFALLRIMGGGYVDVVTLADLVSGEPRRLILPWGYRPVGDPSSLGDVIKLILEQTETGIRVSVGLIAPGLMLTAEERAHALAQELNVDNIPVLEPEEMLADLLERRGEQGATIAEVADFCGITLDRAESMLEELEDVESLVCLPGLPIRFGLPV